MKIKNNALIISPKKTFSSKYQALLQRNNFKVFNIKNLNYWRYNNTPTNNPIDICLIDNHNGDFNFDDFFEKYNTSNLKAVIINVGESKIKFFNNHTLCYNLNPESQSIDLEMLVRNINLVLEREKAQTELVANLMHDLRSPLNSLINYMELLLNETFGALNDGQKNFLEKGMVIGDQVLDMLEEINEVFQDEQYAFHVEKEAFSLQRIIDDSLLKIWIQADAKNIQIKKDIPNNLPSIYGDSFQIQRVFNNLLGNSIKYCPDYSKITIKATLHNKFVEIEIMDNGGGIPDSELKKIFNKYYRIENQKKLKDGQGLGLYISKLIIKAHKGRIQALNNEVGGLSFIFTIPIFK